MSIGLRKSDPPPPPVDHVVWTLVKGVRRVQVVLRAHPLGVQLRCVYKNELLWSEVFKHGWDPADLDRAIEDTRCAWEQKSWTRS